MKFYKIVLQAGHVGRGKYQGLVVYSFGNSMLNRIDATKNLPMTKRQRRMPIIRSEEVPEYEYVVGIVQNPYYNKFNNAESEIADLGYVSNMILHIREYKFKTEEGNKLQDFCVKYSEANSSKKRKEIVVKEYEAWARELIDKYNNKKYNLLSF